VGELDARYCTHPRDELRDPRQRLNVLFLPDAKVTRGDSPLGRDCGRLNKDQPGPTCGTATEMHEVPVIGESIRC
jgi:hypothetical protein